MTPTISSSIPPIDFAHYCSRVPNLMPNLKPMTLSYLDLPSEIRNQVYGLLDVEESNIRRAGFPTQHVPEDGMYSDDDAGHGHDDDDMNDVSTSNSDSDSDSSDSDIDMEYAPVSSEEVVELEEDVTFLANGNFRTPASAESWSPSCFSLLDSSHESTLQNDPDHQYDDDPPKGYEASQNPDQDQCLAVLGFFSTASALPFMWTCKSKFHARPCCAKSN
jgi:hypothetical protein